MILLNLLFYSLCIQSQILALSISTSSSSNATQSQKYNQNNLNQSKDAKDEYSELLFLIPFSDGSILHPLIAYFIWQYIFYDEYSNDDASEVVDNDQVSETGTDVPWFNDQKSSLRVLKDLKNIIRMGNTEQVLEYCLEFNGCCSHLLYDAIIKDQDHIIQYIFNTTKIPLDIGYLMLKSRDNSRVKESVERFIRLERIPKSENLLREAARYNQWEIIRLLILEFGDLSDEMIEDIISIAFGNRNFVLIKDILRYIKREDLKLELVTNAFGAGNFELGKYYIENLKFIPDRVNLQVLVGKGPLNILKYFMYENYFVPNRLAYETAIDHQNIEIADLITKHYGIVPKIENLYSVCKKGLLKPTKYLINVKQLRPNEKALLNAIYSGNHLLVDFLIRNGQITPTMFSLEVSCFSGNIHIFSCIHQNLKRKISQSCLDAAVIGGNLQVVNELTNNGLEPDAFTINLSEDSTVQFFTVKTRMLALTRTLSVISQSLRQNKLRKILGIYS